MVLVMGMLLALDCDDATVKGSVAQGRQNRWLNLPMWVKVAGSSNQSVWREGKNDARKE